MCVTPGEHDIVVIAFVGYAVLPVSNPGYAMDVSPFPMLSISARLVNTGMDSQGVIYSRHICSVYFPTPHLKNGRISV